MFCFNSWGVQRKEIEGGREKEGERERNWFGEVKQKTQNANSNSEFNYGWSRIYLHFYNKYIFNRENLLKAFWENLKTSLKHLLSRDRKERVIIHQCYLIKYNISKQTYF